MLMHETGAVTKHQKSEIGVLSNAQNKQTENSEPYMILYK